MTFFLTDSLMAQTTVKVSGAVRDSVGYLPGVTVQIVGTKGGAVSDGQGRYSLTANINDKLAFSGVGYKTSTVQLTSYKPNSEGVYNVNMSLEVDQGSLEAVTVVGFGKQKKSSVISSITTINPKELKGPTGNLTTMIAGRVAGVISFQRSGEPGADNANFFIRGLGSFGTGKQDPLILIDGIESTNNDLARLQPDDISSFSVLKDASASAVYGARGANGVVLVITKSGDEGKTKFNFRNETSVSGNTRNFQLADNITYMKMADEASLTRNPLAILPYNQRKIDATIAGEDPLLFPNNSWVDMLVKDYTVNNRYNMSVSGGGARAKYYVAGTYNLDNGVLKVADLNNFNSNIKLKNYSVRSNVDLNLTKTTQASIRVYGQFDDYNGPVGGGQKIFNQILKANPVMFAPVYPSKLSPFIKHPLFGNALTPTEGLYVNPYAEMVRGYQESNSSTLQTQLEVTQDLGFVANGLNARVMAYTRRYSYFDVARQYNPFYYSSTEEAATGNILLDPINDGGIGSIGTTGTEFLGYSEGQKQLNSIFYLEAALNYSRTFKKKHAVTAMLITTMRNFLAANTGSLQASLPARNQGVSGRATYGFDNRYLAEFSFGYNGSERFSENNRFGFFPSIGVGYLISNEKWFEPLKNIVTSLKLRGTYGIAGNDQIGNPSERFFYLSEVNLNDASYGASFGELNEYNRPGVSISRYSNPNITWEKSEQLNLAMDISLFNSLDMTLELYKFTRSNILTGRTFIPTTLGLQANVVANTNMASNRGVDFSLNYNKSFSNNMYVQTRGNFTYATNKVLINDEPVFPNSESYRSLVNNPVTQPYGLIAERLFVDDEEAKNSPKQFSGVPGIDYGGGDIKYRDINLDGRIDDADYVPIGNPTAPEIIYGFGGTFGFKGFDVSVFFQGSARSSFFINAFNVSPFVLNGGNQNGLLKVIADSHWSEENRDSYAFFPRLSDKIVDNNIKASTWWLRNGAFLRLKNVELGYTLNSKTMKRLGLSNFRFYANTLNPAVISAFKLWDPELGGNGLGYPIQSVYNVGLNLTF